MSRRFAEGTSVSVEKSRAEIESMLSRYGACKFGYMTSESRASLAFQAQERNVRFILSLPDRKDKRFWQTPARRNARSAEDACAAWEQECRRLWRALALVIKAKLEAVASGVSVFEDEFLAHIVMPDGRTVGEHARPSIAAAYQGRDVPLLLGYGGKDG